jgi:hypothetical protein
MKERSPLCASGPALRCNKCHKLGHNSARCLSSNRFPRANELEVLSCTHEERDVRAVGRDRPTSCFNCGREGQVARFFVDKGRHVRNVVRKDTLWMLVEPRVRNASSRETKEWESRATRRLLTLRSKGLCAIRR